MTIEDVKVVLPKVIFVMLSYVFLGIASGVALQGAGFHPAAIVLLSLLFYTGSGQFLTASMVATSANPWTIILMNLFLALRMSLQSSSLSQYVKDESLSFQLVFGQTTVDEAFGVNTYEFENNPEWTTKNALAANLLPYFTWVVANLLGALLGSVVNIPMTIVNYVLIAMFISMMVDQLNDRIKFLVALVAIILTVVFQVVLQNSISIVLGTVFASALGFGIEKIQMQRGDAHGPVE